MERHTDVSDETSKATFSVEYGRYRFLRNCGIHLRHYAALHFDIVVMTLNLYKIYHGKGKVKLSLCLTS
jgi:hypothetical protein